MSWQSAHLALLPAPQNTHTHPLLPVSCCFLPHSTLPQSPSLGCRSLCLELVPLPLPLLNLCKPYFPQIKFHSLLLRGSSLGLPHLLQAMHAHPMLLPTSRYPGSRWCFPAWAFLTSSTHLHGAVALLCPRSSARTAL